MSYLGLQKISSKVINVPFIHAVTVAGIPSPAWWIAESSYEEGFFFVRVRPVAGLESG